MATVPELIYCADGNERFASIAIEAGFTYGARMPGTVYSPPDFIDQDWKKPDRERYITALEEHRPRMASVLDLERADQLPEVMGWATEAARWVRTVIIIPKVSGIIYRLPRRIGSADVRLGFSVATNYGGTAVSPAEFNGWPVHLLGGSPQEQKRLWVRSGMDVVSVDGNMHLKMATGHNAFFDPLKTTRRGYWPSLVDYDGRKWGDGGKKSDAPYEAFSRSCRNIQLFWHGHLNLLKRKNQLDMMQYITAQEQA